MKGAETANFLQVNEKVEKMYSQEGVEILSTNRAWDKYEWVKEYYKEKPKFGYFVWVRKQTDLPVSTCVSISKTGFRQRMSNLIVIEKGVKAKAIAVCNALKPELGCTHEASGKIILKEGSSLSVEHSHIWGKKDAVFPEYEFSLGKNSRMEYVFRDMNPPKKAGFNSRIVCAEGASAEIKIMAKGANSEMNFHEYILLEGKGSKGTILLRLVADKGTKIRAESEVEAKSASKGHLDCQGILLSNDSKIELIPTVRTASKDSEITHEASIGKISEEKLNYLRSRGLTEDEAVRMIVNGFLSI